MTVNEAAQLTGLSPQTISNHIRTGKLKAEKNTSPNGSAGYVYALTQTPEEIKELMAKVKPKARRPSGQGNRKKDLWTVEELSKAIHKNHSTVYARAKEWGISGFRLEGRVYYPKKLWEKLVERYAAPAKSEPKTAPKTKDRDLKASLDSLHKKMDRILKELVG